MQNYEFIYVLTNIMIVFSIYKLFNTFFDKKPISIWYEVLGYGIYFVLLSVMVFVTRIPMVMLILNLVCLFFISLNYEASMQKKIICTFLIYSILFVIEIICSFEIGFLDISAVQGSSFNSVIGLILIRTVTMIVAYLINRYSVVAKKDFSISPIYYLAFTVILLGTVYLFASSLEKKDITLYNVIISSIILILVNITMIVMDEKIYWSMIMIREKEILEQQTIAYENQSEIITQSTEAIKVIKHDMRNHLMVLSKMYTENKVDEIEVYIGKILNQIDQGAFCQSNNFIIDSIINFKLSKLNSQNVDIQLDVHVPQTIKILAYDLTVILGNLLDNAITAIEQSDEKWLNLQISCNIGNLIILMDNSFNGNIIIEDGKLKTTKLFKANHGVGLGNIEKSLENYGGEIRTQYVNRVFSAEVIIPYKM